MTPINPIDRYNEELLLKVYDSATNGQLERCLDSLRRIQEFCHELSDRPWRDSTKTEVKLALSKIYVEAQKCLQEDELWRADAAADAREDARLEAGDRAADAEAER